MGEPDQVIYMSDQPYTVPAEGVVNYQYLHRRSGLDRPTNGFKPRKCDRATTPWCITACAVQPEKGSATIPEAVGFFGPGFAPYVYPSGAAICVPAALEARVSNALHAQRRRQTDRSMIGIRFADPKTVTKMIARPVRKRR